MMDLFCDNFELVTFDLVSEPAVNGAFPAMLRDHEWIKRGEIVRFKDCIGSVCRVVWDQDYHPVRVHVHFFSPTEWFDDKRAEELLFFGTVLDAMADL
jgi:hypothetical protein